MYRVLAILLMLLVPLQVAWSSVESVRGHLDGEASEYSFHHHDGGHAHHHGAEPADHDGLLAGGIHNSHNDDGHHDGHCHPVFSMLVIEPDLKLSSASPDGPPVRRLYTFTSYTPLLFDRPPSAFL